MPIRTVIVDDEDDVRSLLRLRLERAGGFNVIGEGTDGLEAISLCAELQPDVVVLDAAMPGLDGLAAVPDLRVAAPHTIVVIYTAEVGVGTRDAAEKVGAHAVVGKLDPSEMLIGTIRRLRPERALADPARQERADFGSRMSALLEDEVDAEKPKRTGRARPPTRVGLLVVAAFVLLPVLAAVLWVVAALAGLGSG